MSVSTVDQHPETQLHDLRQMAAQRGYQIVAEVTDKISGAKARRPGLDELMREARRGRFDVVLVWPAIESPDPPGTSLRSSMSSIDSRLSSLVSARASTLAARWVAPS